MIERLMAALPQKTRELYFTICPDESLRQHYEHALDHVLRWQGGTLRPINPTFQETVLDHYVNLLEEVTLVETKHPALAKEIDFTVVRAILICHDAGELYKGDLDKTDPRYHTKEGKRLKRTQRLYAHLAVFSHLPWHAQQQVDSWYHEFEKIAGSTNGVPNCLGSTNTEALFARLLDLLQGNRTSQMQFFYHKKLPPERQTRAFLNLPHRSLREIVDLFETFESTLLSPAALHDLGDIALNELGIYATTMRLPTIGT